MSLDASSAAAVSPQELMAALPRRKQLFYLNHQDMNQLFRELAPA
ncbi:MAG TPA: hypothetical protein VGS19_36840 [Streptosporangiaceae bacterium]|nr:hypothetical protein [Streptosporangiaceae bacterium]